MRLLGIIYIGMWIVEGYEWIYLFRIGNFIISFKFRIELTWVGSWGEISILR